MRYLGDLSGGQMVGRTVAQTYRLGRDGVTFYSFDRIDDPRAYKVAYRSRLDALPFPEETLAALVAESQLAFRLNAAVFSELGAAYPDDYAPAA